METYSDLQVVITHCHNWSVGRISWYTLFFGSPFHSLNSLHPLLPCVIPSTFLPPFLHSHLDAYIFPCLSRSFYFLLSLLVAVSAFVPSSSLLNPATVESLFIPAPVYLPSLSVCLSRAHCLVFLSSPPPHPACEFVGFSLNPTHSPYCTSHISLSRFFVYLTLSLLKPRATVA